MLRGRPNIVIAIKMAMVINIALITVTLIEHGELSPRATSRDRKGGNRVD